MPMPAPAVNKVTIWMARMQSLPVSLEKFQMLIPIMKRAISILLSGDLCLIFVSLGYKFGLNILVFFWLCSGYVSTGAFQIVAGWW